jgi:hypothetical protein
MRGFATAKTGGNVCGGFFASRFLCRGCRQYAILTGPPKPSAKDAIGKRLHFVSAEVVDHIVGTCGTTHAIDVLRTRAAVHI